MIPYAVEYQVAYHALDFRVIHLITGKASAYVRHVKAMNRIGDDDGPFLYVIDAKVASFHAGSQDIHHQDSLFLRDYRTRAIYFPYIPEKARAQRTVARNYLTHRLQPAFYIFIQLLFWRYRLSYYMTQLLKQLRAFTLDNGIEDITFALEICIDGAAPFLGCRGDIVHSGVLNALSGEKLTRHLYEFVPCLFYHTSC